MSDPVGAALPAPEGSAAAVFRNRPFLLLWLSQLATQVGGNMVLYGLTVLVYGATASSSAVSILILTYLTPAVVFSALAGVYVDRFDRRQVLVVTNLLRFVLFLSLALLDANILAVFVLNVLVSIVTTFFAPAELSMIPLVVPRAQLTAANGIFTLTLNAAFAIGFTVMGPLVVSVANPTVLVVAVAALYLLAAGFCWTLPPGPPGMVPHGAALHEAEAAVGSFVSQFREGMAYVREHPVVSWALLYLGIAASIVGVLGVLGPGFAEAVLGLRPKDFVVIVLPLGVGVVTGALTVNALQALISRRRLIELGLVALGVCLGGISIAGPIAQFARDVNDAVPGPDLSAFVSILTVVVAIAFVAGIAYAAVAIPAQTELQAEIPEAVRGRVFGILNMLVSVGSFLPIIIVGPIADLVGTMPVVLAAAALILLVGVLSLAVRDRRAGAPAGVPAAPPGGPAPLPEAPTLRAGGPAPTALPGPSPEEP
ncbi:MAG: MFS transporter [Chloroflexi bacterium]|nr:MFS transporter [Chloroflexota bacterium]